MDLRFFNTYNMREGAYVDMEKILNLLKTYRDLIIQLETNIAEQYMEEISCSEGRRRSIQYTARIDQIVAEILDECRRLLDDPFIPRDRREVIQNIMREAKKPRYSPTL